ncbi:MAG: PQQ-binding-like beta-propeller repeat protein [Planctomycetota bacterium]|nr:PQQ-binding-like beta-propeller repeat protein [Planctomycetota bacterium]
MIPAEPKSERAVQDGLPAAERSPTNDWPCWRGPNAAGVADGRKLPLRWSRTENVRWSVKLPGWGTSSPVVDAKTHAELWRYGEGEGPFNGEIIVSPTCGDDLVFLQLWRQSRIHAIRLTGDQQPPEPAWVSDKPGPQEPSLLYYRGLLYALLDNGVLVCLDGKTGQEQYRERLGAACNSSPIVCDGRIYVSDNTGTTFVVQAGRQYRLLTTNELDERITASPAISGNELIYRTDSQLYCLGLSLGQ